MRFRPSRILILGLVILAILLVPAILFGFNTMRSRGMAAYFANRVEPALPVSVSKAEIGEVPRDMRAIGSLQAVHQVTVSAEIGGRITEIKFEPGATVAAGETLVQLNDAPARGDLANYEAQRKLAELSLHRSQTLVRRQFESQANVDQNQAQLDQAKAGIAKTQAQLAQLVVRAPFSGVLGVRQIDLGQIVTSGQPIVTLTDTAKLYVNFTLPEQDRSRLVIGQTVTVTSDAYPGKSFQAKLTTVEPQISADTRMITLQATLDNPKRQLLPGMYVNASVILPSETNVITVPETAVDYSLYGDSVWVVDQATGGNATEASYKVERRFIHVGRRFAGKAAVQQGIQAGQLVVTSGQLRLSNGAAVKIEPGTGLQLPATIPTE